MAEWVGALLECASHAFGPIYRNIRSFFKLQSNLNSLHNKKRVLREIEDHVKLELEAADKQGRSPTPQVKEWLRQAAEILVTADPMEPGMGRGRCFLSCRICRKVRKTLEEVERVTDACPPERVVPSNRAPPTVEHIPAPSIQDQTTAAQNMKQVMDVLNQDQVHSVGIWGMGGVGKTTLAKNLNNKLQSGGSLGNKFGIVIWATVSKDFNLKRVQTQIANRLNFRVGSSDDEDRMAVALHKRFMKETKFLLILDDLWEPIDLDKLGVPRPQLHKGVKIVLTSRSKRVCESTKADELVQVRVLNDKEAWELFVETAGNVASLEEIKPIAQNVCKQCCGLPLAIVIVGAAMRGKATVPLWSDALSELQRSVPSIDNVEKEVFKPLKWSYDKLQGNNVKSCFLYCCLYPEDFEIEVSELVRCWMGEGFIGEELDYEESFNRGLALIQNLKEACLLEGSHYIGTEGEIVKMHDVVRDVAIWISSNHLEDGCKFWVRAGIGLTLTQLSKVQFPRDVKRLSLMNNQIDRLSSDDNACLTECSTLFLQGNRSLVEIPDGFLRRFQAVRVLNLSNTNINSLPSSIMDFINLETLLLRRCGKLEELPTSGWEKIKRMQVFDLFMSGIRVLPIGLGMLVKLRELNLFGTRSLESIPAGMFSMLSSLEILNMEGSKYILGLKGGVEDEEAYLEELESLKTLHGLSIQLKPKSVLGWIINPTWIQRLRQFTLCIGAWPNSLREFNRKKEELIMSGIDPSEEKTEYLLSTTNATFMWFYECVGLEKLIQNMGLNTGACFSALKCLIIQDASINLRASSCVGKHDLLPNLEKLWLHRVGGMRSISELVGHLGLTFAKLQQLHVSDCHVMKYLLSVDHHLILKSVTKVVIQRCNELEEVFEYVPHPHGHTIEVVPKLSEIYLEDLWSLRTLCDNNERDTWQSLERISVNKCPNLRKLPVSGQNNNIKSIRGEERWWSNLEWDDPNTSTSLQPLFFQVDEW